VNSVGNVSMKGSLVVAGALLFAALAAAQDSGGASLKLLRQFLYEREGANLPRKLRECQNYEFLSGIQTRMESNAET
jgi:hypothetical protein